MRFFSLFVMFIVLSSIAFADCCKVGNKFICTDLNGKTTVETESSLTQLKAELVIQAHNSAMSAQADADSFARQIADIDAVLNPQDEIAGVVDETVYP